MKLGVKDRILLGSLLPSEADFVTLKVVRQLREALSFSDEELQTLDIVQSDGMVKWSSDGESKIGEKDFLISGKVFEMISDSLKKLDQQKKLTEDYISLYEKFVVGE